MPVVDVKVDKVDDKTVHHAIEQVTQCAADNHRESDVIQALSGAAAIHQYQQNDHNSQCNQSKEPTLPAAFIRQEAKRRPWVVSISQVKERDQRHGFAKLKMPHDQELAAEIKDD